MPKKDPLQEKAEQLCERLAKGSKSKVGKGEEPKEGKKIRSSLSSERPRRKDEGKRSKDDTATARLADRLEGTTQSPQRKRGTSTFDKWFESD